MSFRCGFLRRRGSSALVGAAERFGDQVELHAGHSGKLGEALDAAYAADPGRSAKVMPELTLIMLPAAWLLMIGRTACRVISGATRLRSSRARKSSGSISSTPEDAPVTSTTAPSMSM